MFVVCGEALMDVFAVGETAHGVQLDARIGGSPFNVAIGLARMGQPVGFFGGVSTGFLGERLLRALREEGVDVSCTPRSTAPTTLGLVGLDANEALHRALQLQAVFVRNLNLVMHWPGHAGQGRVGGDHREKPAHRQRGRGCAERIRTDRPTRCRNCRGRCFLMGSRSGRSSLRHCAPHRQLPS